VKSVLGLYTNGMALLHGYGRHATAKVYFSTAGFNMFDGGGIHVLKRLCRHAHCRLPPASQEAILKDLQSVRGRDFIAGDIACTHNNGLPEQCSNAITLSPLVEQAAKRAVANCSTPTRPHSKHAPHATPELPLVCSVQQFHASKRTYHVQRGRKPTRSHDVTPTIWAKPGRGLIPLNVINNTKPRVEIEQFCATSHEHMLTVIER
jgi:hypothetical protein